MAGRPRTPIGTFGTVNVRRRRGEVTADTRFRDADGRLRRVAASDAHAIAAVALRTPNLRVLGFEEELLALRLLSDRRDELSVRRVQTVNRLHRLLTELIAGGADKNLSTTKAKRLLATIRPGSLVGKTTRRLAAEELAGHSG